MTNGIWKRIVIPAGPYWYLYADREKINEPLQVLSTGQFKKLDDMISLFSKG